MKVTVITPVYNGASVIKTCIDSVLNQTYTDIEYIIIDAVSKDDTLAIIKNYNSDKIVYYSEKDKGSCDALNKGILKASGDIVCFLCADDFYINNTVIEKVVNYFTTHNVDACYSDIVYVKRDDINSVTRYWKSSEFSLGKYSTGWLPPHTSLFIKKEKIIKSGLFNLQFKYAADYELSYRLFEIDKIKTGYIPELLVKMRSGGVSNSSATNIYKSLRDCYNVLKYHHVKYPILYIINTLIYRFNQIFIPKRLKAT